MGSLPGGDMQLEVSLTPSMCERDFLADGMLILWGRLESKAWDVKTDYFN